MHNQLLAVLPFTMATLASAFPTTLDSRQDTTWTANSNGNVRIIFSDQTVNIGTLPLSAIIGNLTDACNTAGLCDTSPISITGYQLVAAGTDGSVNDETVTVNPSGAYQTWIHNGLLEALQAAIGAAAQCQDVTNDPNCGDSPYYCPSQPFTVNECTVPQFWGVNYQDPTATTDAPSYMELTLDVAVDTGSGFCSTFATVGSAVAGAVNGAAGGIFSLIGLACQ